MRQNRIYNDLNNTNIIFIQPNRTDLYIIRLPIVTNREFQFGFEFGRIAVFNLNGQNIKYNFFNQVNSKNGFDLPNNLLFTQILV